MLAISFSPVTVASVAAAAFPLRADLAAFAGVQPEVVFIASVATAAAGATQFLSTDSVNTVGNRQDATLAMDALLLGQTSASPSPSSVIEGKRAVQQILSSQSQALQLAYNVSSVAAPPPETGSVALIVNILVPPGTAASVLRARLRTLALPANAASLAAMLSRTLTAFTDTGGAALQLCERTQTQSCTAAPGSAVIGSLGTSASVTITTLARDRVTYGPGGAAPAPSLSFASLPLGAYIGIGVGSLFFLCLSTALLACVVCARRHKRRAKIAPEELKDKKLEAQRARTMVDSHEWGEELDASSLQTLGGSDDGVAANDVDGPHADGRGSEDVPIRVRGGTPPVGSDEEEIEVAVRRLLPSPSKHILSPNELARQAQRQNVSSVRRPELDPHHYLMQQKQQWPRVRGDNERRGVSDHEESPGHRQRTRQRWARTRDSEHQQLRLEHAVDIESPLPKGRGALQTHRHLATTLSPPHVSSDVVALENVPRHTAQARGLNLALLQPAMPLSRAMPLLAAVDEKVSQEGLSAITAASAMQQRARALALRSSRVLQGSGAAASGLIANTRGAK